MATINEYKDEGDWGEWFEVWDPNSQANYYYNNNTGETSWEKPEGYKSPTEGEGGKGMADLYPPHLRSVLKIQSVYRGKKARGKMRIKRAETQAKLSSNEATPQTKWITVNDPGCGCDYFYNTETGETSWERPLDMGTTGENKIEEEPDLPEWVEMFDPSSGQYYYFNNITQESVWDKPDNYKIPELGKAGRQLMSKELKAALLIQATWRTKMARRKMRIQRGLTSANLNTDSSEGSPCVWQKLNDPSSGCDYYYNSETSEVSWELPEDFVQSSSLEAPIMETEAEGEQEESDQSKEVESLEWIEMWDPASEKSYFLNQITQESSWEKPSGFVEVKDKARMKDLMCPELKAALKMQGAYRAKVARRKVRKRRAEIEQEIATTEVRSTDSNIPRPWQVHNDPATNCDYYYNPDTEEVSWEKPTDTTVTDTSVGQNDSVKKTLDKSLPEWIKLWDATADAFYYFNQITSESVWDVPEGYEEPAEDLGSIKTLMCPEVRAAVLVQGLWRAKVARREMRKQRGKVENALNENEEKEEWSKLLDSTSGCYYFYNNTTFEVRWDDPNAQVQDERETAASEEEDNDGGEQEEEETDLEDESDYDVPSSSKENDAAKQKVKSLKKNVFDEVDEVEPDGKPKKKAIFDDDNEEEAVTGEEKTSLEDEPKELTEFPSRATNDPRTLVSKKSFRSNDSIRRLKVDAERRAHRDECVDKWKQELIVIQVNVVVTRHRFLHLKALAAETNELFADREEFATKSKNISQSFKVAELALDESTKQLDEVRSTLDSGNYEELEMDDKITSTRKNSVFAEAQLSIAVRAYFSHFCIVLESSNHEMCSIVQQVREHENMERRARVQLLESQQAIKMAELRVKHVQTFSHRNFVTETTQKERFDSYLRNRAGRVSISTGLVDSQLSKCARAVSVMENRMYQTSFQETAIDGEETFKSEMGLGPAADVCSPWWPSYMAAINACKNTNTLVNNLGAFIQKAIQTFCEARECRLMLAEEASQKALAAAKRGIFYEIKCRQKFVALCRAKWEKGLALRRADQGLTDTERKGQDDKLDKKEKSDSVDSRRPIVNKDVFRSPWQACQAFSTLEQFMDAYNNYQQRRVCQEKKRFEINAPDAETGRILLHTACWYSRVDIAKFVLSQGADVNAYNSSLDTTRALHIAVQANSSSMVKLLCDAGACLVVKDAQGDTPLHWACRVDSLPIVRTLLAAIQSKQREESGDEYNGADEIYWKLLGSLNDRNRTATDLLPRTLKKARDTVPTLSYIGTRIYELLRPHELEAQQRELEQDKGIGRKAENMHKDRVKNVTR